MRLPADANFQLSCGASTESGTGRDAAPLKDKAAQVHPGGRIAPTMSTRIWKEVLERPEPVAPPSPFAEGRPLESGSDLTSEAQGHIASG